MSEQYGKSIDVIRGKRYLSAASIFIGFIFFVFFSSNLFSFPTLIACACLAFGVLNMFNSIELYEDAIIIKSMFQRVEIWRDQIEMINFGNYDPNIFDLDRYAKTQLKIFAVNGTVKKLPYTAYKDLYNKIRGYQQKYNIPAELK